jgi:hypothetical protein
MNHLRARNLNAASQEAPRQRFVPLWKISDMRSDGANQSPSARQVTVWSTQVSRGLPGHRTPTAVACRGAAPFSCWLGPNAGRSKMGDGSAKQIMNFREFHCCSPTQLEGPCRNDTLRWSSDTSEHSESARGSLANSQRARVSNRMFRRTGRLDSPANNESLPRRG